ncbi:MAG: hypothetical protein JAY90_20245 [Candidatus Thiodiazotropha lotti]|nr:hypothetical protein [Candidatus Thiodiazotropha lotti]
MPTIPNVTTLRRRDDSGQAAVSSYSTEGVTAALDESAKFADDLREKRLRSQASKAEADMMVFMEQQKTAFDHDDDYETIEKRWNEGVTDQFGRIASTIQDGEVREQFIQKYRPRIEAQRGFMRDLAWGKEKDQDRADILERSQGIKDAFARSGDPEVISTGYALFENSKGFDQEEIAAAKQSFGIEVVKGRLSVISEKDPDQAIALLQSEVGENLPEGERAKLIQNYQEKSIGHKAIGLAQGYMDRDLSISEGMSEAESIEDPRLREAVEKRFNYAKRMEKAGEIESQAKVHEYWHVKIGPKGDGSSIEDIPDDQWLILGAGQRQNLEALQYDEPKRLSDPRVLINLADKALTAERTKDWTEYNQFLSENSSKLSQKDLVSNAVISLEAQHKGLNPEAISDLTDKQMVRAAMGEAYNEKNAAVLLGKFDDWKMIKRAAGKEPDDSEKKAALDRFILNYDDHWGWGSDPYYQLTEDQVKENLRVMKESNPGRFRTIYKLFAANRTEPTDDQILMLMRDDMTDADVEEWFRDNYR